MTQQEAPDHRTPALDRVVAALLLPEPGNSLADDSLRRQRRTAYCQSHPKPCKLEPVTRPTLQCVYTAADGPCLKGSKLVRSCSNLLSELFGSAGMFQDLKHFLVAKIVLLGIKQFHTLIQLQYGLDEIMIVLNNVWIMCNLGSRAYLHHDDCANLPTAAGHVNAV